MPEQSPVTTFFFTDIEGSSRLWEADPGGMQPALAEHDRSARAAVREHRGTVVKMTGDGICASFADPLDAVAAAVALQIALAEQVSAHRVPLHARCGMHVGVGEFRDADYFGKAVNRAARIMSVAHGGQTLLSQAAAELVRERLPSGVSLKDLGVVRLRDLVAPEHLWQLVHPALRNDFPAIRSLATTPTNLPQQLTSFVGREKERAEVHRLLATTRLLTLHGAGGIGKTRLSIEIAAEALDQYPAGAWFVELAPLTDGRMVPRALASVLGVKEDSAHPLVDALARSIGDQRMLVVLDNCEHLVGACAQLADHLLRETPNLRIVASSREPLGIRGELLYPVPALPVPGPDAVADAEAAMQSDAVHLFAERARASTSTFALTAGNAGAVATICRRLDGIPLAIELAAARVRVLSVESIASRLDDRFRLLTSGARLALPRQQTLRALIDWSFELLSAREQTLFSRLSVFAGGWTLEAAEAVCAFGGIGSAEILDLLTGLVEKSLVVAEPERGRYRLLDTMQQYAQQRLHESGESATARAAHAGFFLALAERTRAALAGPEQADGLQRLDVERENMLAAHAACSLIPDGVSCGLRLVHALKQYWAIRGLLGLGYHVTVEALARCEPGEQTLAYSQALSNAGQLALWSGRSVEAQQYLDHSLAIARVLEDKRRVARVLQPLGAVALALGDTARARADFEEALRLAEELGDQRELAAAMMAIAQLDRMEGALDTAESHYRKALALARAIGDLEIVAIGWLNLAMVAIARGADSDARGMLLEVIRIANDIGSRAAGKSTLEVSAGLASRAEAWERSASFYGMAEAQADHTGIRRDAADAAFLDPLIQRTRLALGDDVFKRAETAGRRRSYEDAIEEARAWLAGSS